MSRHISKVVQPSISSDPISILSSSADCGSGSGAFSMSESAPPSLRSGPYRSDLSKQKSWSPDIHREEAWANRRRNFHLRRGRSVTDDDLEELRGCLDLGFDFAPTDLDKRLSSSFPAAELLCAVKRSYSSNFSRSSSALSESDTASFSSESPKSIVDPADDPEVVKTKLKQWAQVVACSVRHCSNLFFNSSEKKDPNSCYL